jgi:lambda repressor-like predicted transcriptional regulator
MSHNGTGEPANAKDGHFKDWTPEQLAALREYERTMRQRARDAQKSRHWTLNKFSSKYQ